MLSLKYTYFRMNPSNFNPWVITPIEHQQNEVQFMTLNPRNGMITGDAARNLFLKSGLPTQILAQVRLVYSLLGNEAQI